MSYTNGNAAIILADYKKDQNLTSFVYANDKAGSQVTMASLHGEENRVWANLGDMSPYLSKAFVSLEDKRFNEHKGVDWVRFLGVMTKYNFDQGGSTITQQLIKNITGEKDVTAVRKFKEILSALNMEKNYTKDTILEAYLNTVALGNGCYGVRTASEKYFGKDVKDLNLAECAAIAAITKAPFTYEPLTKPDSNKERRLYCLNEMLTQGVINNAEYDDAVNYNLILTNSPDYVPTVVEEAPVVEPTEFQSYYVDFIIDNVIDDLKSKYGYTEQQATQKIYYGGLKIYAAVDIDVQKALEDVYFNRITFPKQNDTPENPAVQSAMTVMDYQGRVVGIIGGAGAKKSNRCLNRAADSPRQPGSSIKPLAIYAPAIDMKYVNWSTMIRDYAFPYQGKKLWPTNVDESFGSGGNVTVQRAIEKSLNTVAARIVVDTLKPQTSYDFLENKFHVSTLDPKSDFFAAPMAVGALTNGITTLEQAAAYTAFGNGGKYYKPYCYYKVTNNDGTEVLLETVPVGEQIIKPETADIMCELLQTVSTSEFGKGSNVRNFQIMAKTGTTDQDKDRWICAGTPYYFGAVWYGYDKPRDIAEYPNPAGKVLIEVFDRIHKDLEAKKFEKSGLTVQRSYCTSSGYLAGKGCASTKTGWYSINNLPKTCTSCSGPAASIVDNVIDSVIDIITPDTTIPSATEPPTPPPTDPPPAPPSEPAP